MTTFDAIIIGGGHNGLICAAYLAKAGKSVIVLEAGTEVGGMAKNSTLANSYTVSLASTLMPFDTKLVKELGLSLHVTPIKTGSLLSPSFEEAEKLTAFQQEVSAYVAALRPLFTAAPIDIFTPDWGDKKLAFKLAWKLRFGLGKDQMRELLRIIGMNIYDWLDEKFDDPLLKGMVAFDACLSHAVGPRTAGTVFTYLYRHAMGGKAILPLGGMGSVTEALKAAAEKAGAIIRTNARVKKVLVKSVAVTGVELESEEQILAPTVLSSADPKTTVFDLVGARHFEADFVKAIDNIRMKGSTAKLHILLDGLPDFGEGAQDRMIIAGTHNQLERAFNPMKYGELPDKPVMELLIPTVHDSSLAPEGHHILSATIPFVPYALKGGWTDEAKMTFRKVCIDRIAEFAPDIHGKIIEAELLTPPDIEARYGSFGGHWHQGELALDQVVMMRPTPGAARYTLPLDGLYLCGAGTHPGGGVTGLAGKLAAEAVLKGGK